MTPVLTRAPTMMNRPAKNDQGRPLDVLEELGGSSRDSATQGAGAEQRDHATVRGAEHGCRTNADQHQGQHDAAADQQPRSRMASRSSSAITSATRSAS